MELESQRPHDVHVSSLERPPASQLDEHGLHHLFQKYGRVLHVDYKAPLGSGGRYAFVSYSSGWEASCAIEALNGTAPFHLSVRPALNNTLRQATKKAADAAAQATPGLKEFLIGYPLSLPRELPRGCQSCEAEGKLRCSRCKAWYCSQKCQFSDWTTHRRLCMPPPPLEHEDGTPLRRAATDEIRQPIFCQDVTSEIPKPTSPSQVKEVPIEVNVSQEAQQATTDESQPTTPTPPEPKPTPQGMERPQVLHPKEETPRILSLPRRENVEEKEVIFSHFHLFTDQCYVQEDLAALVEFEERLNEEVNANATAKTRQMETPIKGEILTCFWEEERSFYRGEVLSVDMSASQVRIRFVDYGNETVASFDHLGHLPTFCHLTPPFATLIHLANVKSLPLGEHRNLSKSLETLLELPLTLSFDGDGKAVLTNQSEGSRINEAIQTSVEEGLDCHSDKKEEKGLCVLKQSDEVNSGSIKYDSSKVVELSVNDSHKVFVLNVESTTKIYVTPSDALSQADALSERVAKHVAGVSDAKQESDRFKPVVDTLCLAQSEDEQWYRAVIVDLKEAEKANLFFVDFGFQEDVLLSSMLPIPRHLAEHPFLAVHCAIIHKEVDELEDIVRETLQPFEEVDIFCAAKEGIVHRIKSSMIEKKILTIESALKKEQEKRRLLEQMEKIRNKLSDLND